jgi:hypothetical protein
MTECNDSAMKNYIGVTVLILIALLAQFSPLLHSNLGLDVHLHDRFFVIPLAKIIFGFVLWSRRAGFCSLASAENRLGLDNPKDEPNLYDFTSAFSFTWPATVSTTYSTSRQFCLSCKSFVFFRTNSLNPACDSLLVSSPACFLALTNA